MAPLYKGNKKPPVTGSTGSTSEEIAQWNLEDFTGPVTTTHTVTDSNGITLQAYLNGLGTGNHVVNVEGNYQFTPPNNASPAVSLGNGVTVSLRGSGTISLAAEGNQWMINSGAKLILRGPALRGKAGNTLPVVTVNTGIFVMKKGTISGNIYAGPVGNGGGVEVRFMGTFSMDDGTISGNTANFYGGGVHVASGTFTMNGGIIRDNSAGSGGGGVNITSGSFTKTGGIIYGKDGGPNSNTTTAGDTNGHAVYTSNGPNHRDNTLWTGDSLSTSDTITNWND